MCLIPSVMKLLKKLASANKRGKRRTGRRPESGSATRASGRAVDLGRGPGPTPDRGRPLARLRRPAHPVAAGPGESWPDGEEVMLSILTAMAVGLFATASAAATTEYTA